MISELTREVFSLICSQNPAHTWAPNGVPLPLCERCTGFYVGAAIALVLLLWFRPVPNRLFRWLHAMLVLAMTPFGFHLVSHGAILRTMSGQWFGFGVVGLLWLLPGARLAQTAGGRVWSTWLHPLIGAASIVALPFFAGRCGAFAAALLPPVALIGLAVLAGLWIANTAILVSTLSSHRLPHAWRAGS